MSCDIKKNDPILINGSSSHYGGILKEFTLNYGDLSSGSQATITIVKSEDKPLQEPALGDKFDIKVGSSTIAKEFKVASFELSKSSESINTLRVNLIDSSNEYLDHDFVFLNDDFPDSENVQNIHMVGAKFGPLPHELMTRYTGLISANSDNKWGGIRNFFKKLQPLSWKADKFLPLNDDEINYQTKSYNGKSLGYWKDIENAEDYICQVGNSKTYYEVLEKVLIQNDVTIPNGPYDFTGSFREVIIQLCNLLGIFPYWDAEQKKVKLEQKIDIKAGVEKVESLISDCQVISQSKSKNFTRSQFQGAAGFFSSSHPGEDHKSQGSQKSRYFRCKLLTPDVYYVPCGGTGDDAILINITDPDVLKAMAASTDPKVYANYVVETVIQSNLDSGTIPEKTITRKANGQDNKIEEIEYNLEDIFKKPSEDLFTINKFLQSYYCNSGFKEGICTGFNNLIPVVLDTSKKSVKQGAISFDEALVGEAFSNFRSKNLERDVDPCKTLGKFSDDGSQGTFENGFMLLHKKGTLHSIISENGINFDASGDVLRKFLQNLMLFKKRVYVVKDFGVEGKEPVKISGKDYGYYITSENSGFGFNPKVNDGFQLMPINPFQSIFDTEVSVIRDLAMTCLMMFARSGDLEEYKEIAVIDFINVLETNRIKDFFTNPRANRNIHQDRQSFITKHDFGDPQMWIVYRKPGEGEFKFFEDSEAHPFEQGDYLPTTEEHIVKSIKQTCQLSLPKNISNFFKIERENLRYEVGGQEFFKKFTFEDQWSLFGYKKIPSVSTLHNLITPLKIDDKAEKIVRLWFNSDGIGSNIKTADGHFYMSSINIPKYDKELVWKGSINSNISLNGADLGLNNEIFSLFESSTADMSSIYSVANRQKMVGFLNKKVENASFVDVDPGESTKVHIIADGSLDLPTITEGLESLNFSIDDNGALSMHISVGNSLLLKQKQAMRELISGHSKLNHSYGSITADPLSSISSQKFISQMKGLL